MNLLNKLSTKAKLKFDFGIILTSIVILIIVSFSSIKMIENSNNQIKIIDTITSNLTELRSDENRLISLTLELLLANDESYNDTIKANIKFRTTSTEKRISAIDSALINFPDQKNQFRNLTMVLKEYRNNRNPIVNLVNKGKNAEASVYIKNIQIPLYDGIRLNILDLEKQLNKIAEQDTKRNESLIRIIYFTFLLLGLVIIIISLLLAVYMIKMLRKISIEIRNGVTILGTSAAEILSTVTEISTGTAETSTSVSEITTTVEEVRQTSVISNQKAQLLLDSSQRAATSVDKGRESIKEVIVSMKKIDAQMGIISDTVLKLSDQNRTIGEITTSVADIADQSNLLAVNAAIEAAKAGEHGRGFTVVAQEIRSLADQSKKATAQVKEILNEINKSVNQAVGVTEQGSRTVEEGRNLVTQCGEVIELLAENVEETAQASIQISSSNQQQMAGMEQVVPAMENIKIASQQNVTGIKQAQTAAHELNTLGQNLKEIIEKFNL